jgi:hypothetical protein
MIDNRPSLFTREQAVQLAKTGWWKNKPAKLIALFQLQEPHLCMDFSAFQDAVQEFSDSSLSTIAFTNPEGLLRMVSGGEPVPSLIELAKQIPEAYDVLGVPKTGPVNRIRKLSL